MSIRSVVTGLKDIKAIILELQNKTVCNTFFLSVVRQVDGPSKKKKKSHYVTTCTAVTATLLMTQS